jgi:hypothetical protein
MTLRSIAKHGLLLVAAFALSALAMASGAGT